MVTHSSILAWRIPWTEEWLLYVRFHFEYFMYTDLFIKKLKLMHFSRVTGGTKILTEAV